MNAIRFATRTFVALIAASAGTAMAAGSAAAETPHRYCESPVPAHSPCWQSAAGFTLSENWAIYAGAGTVGVCERVVTLEGGNTISRRCNYTRNSVSSLNDLDPYPSAYKESTVGNDSDWTHTINGVIWTNP